MATEWVNRSVNDFLPTYLSLWVYKSISVGLYYEFSHSGIVTGPESSGYLPEMIFCELKPVVTSL